MTGVAYKEIVINDICHYKVRSNITVGLALMFRYSIFVLNITPIYAYLYTYILSILYLYDYIF